MNKIICIGECALDIVFGTERPIGSILGGRIAMAAMHMARKGLPVVMASETSADPIGDMLVGYLTDAGVDCSAVDRFTQGHSPLTVFTPSEAPEAYKATRYENYGDGGFDIVWPRVDDRTIVVYGGYYTLDERMRTRLVPFLQSCCDHKAIMVYVPGFRPDRCSRITRVMPAIFENLEFADMVVTRSEDLQHIFGAADGNTCYRNHIDYYCHSMVNVDPTAATLAYYTGKESTKIDLPTNIGGSLLLNAGIIAGVAGAIFNRDLYAANLDGASEEIRSAILRHVADEAIAASANVQDDWQLKI